MKTTENSTERPGRLSLEQLEERIAPAGSVGVHVVGGNLVITGDDQANDITIDQDGLGAGSFNITPNNGTQILDSFPGATVTMNGVTGGITIKMGDGADVVTLDGVTIVKNLSFDAGKGAYDTLVVTGSSVIQGGLAFKGGSGHDTITLADVTVGKNVQLSGSDGTTFFASGAIHGSLSTRSGALDDALTLSDLTVNGAITVSNGAGDASTSINDVTASSLKITNGTGTGIVSMTLSAFANNVSISNGKGNATTSIANSSVHGALSIKNSTGDATVNIGESTVDGKVSVSSGAGAVNYTIDSSNLGIGNGVDKFNDVKLAFGRSTAKNNITVEDGSSIGGSLTVTGGAAQSSLEMYDSAVGKNFTMKAAGGGTIGAYLNSSDILGSATITGGGGEDYAEFVGVHVYGKTAFNMGGSYDEVYIDAPVDGDGSGFRSHLDGAATFKMGAGDDEFYFGDYHNDNHTVYGAAVTIDGGSGQYDTIYSGGNENEFAPGITPKVTGFEYTEDNTN